jgi:hypothetical protein
MKVILPGSISRKRLRSAMERSLGDPMEPIPVEKLADRVLDEKTACTGRRAEEMGETSSGDATGAISAFTQSLSE